MFTAPDGRILDANAAACRLLGRSRDEICRAGRAGLVDPSDTRWRAAIAEREATGRFVGTLSMLRGDGTPAEFAVSSAVFPNADGEFRTVVVMREAADAPETADVAFVDPSGVLNAPAFINQAEQQCRSAARHHLGLALVYFRLAEVDGAGRLEPPGPDAQRTFAEVLRAESRWGDVVGRVERDDFVMLVHDDEGDSLSAIVRPIYAHVEALNVNAPRRLHVHVGTKHFRPDADTRVMTMLNDASTSMCKHENRANSFDRPCARRCFFALDDPSVLAPAEVVSPTNIPELTERERAVMRLLATRRSYKEIARTLYVSLNTVKTHVSHVYSKLGVSSRKEAVARAKAAGLVTAEPPVLLAAPADDATIDLLHEEPPASHHHEVDFGRIALVVQALTSAVDADEMLDIVVMQGLAGLDADAALVAFIAGDVLVPVAAYGYTDESVAAFFPAPLRAELPITIAAREKTSVWISDRDEMARRFPAVLTSPLVQSNAWIAVPLVAEGRAFGALGVSFLEPHDFSSAEREYLRSLTNLSALALHRELEHATVTREILGRGSVIKRLRKGAGWPRGGWLLSELPSSARRRLAAEGYEIMEDRAGRIIVEPPRA
jgi:DNA-binding CsgD family transcriptional regulator/GGDEF domain-containing protein